MTPFNAFLEARGFQADACEALEHPDFYALANELWQALHDIADQSKNRHARNPSGWLVGNIARTTLGIPVPD